MKEMLNILIIFFFYLKKWFNLIYGYIQSYIIFFVGFQVESSRHRTVSVLETQISVICINIVLLVRSTLCYECI